MYNKNNSGASDLYVLIFDSIIKVSMLNQGTLFIVTSTGVKRGFILRGSVIKSEKFIGKSCITNTQQIVSRFVFILLITNAPFAKLNKNVGLIFFISALYMSHFGRISNFFQVKVQMRSQLLRKIIYLFIFKLYRFLFLLKLHICNIIS